MSTSLITPRPRPVPLRLEVSTLAEIVSGLATASGLWQPHVAHDPRARVRVRLLATPAYEVWLLGWSPGQSVGLHDHGDANGAFVVVDGELVESSLTTLGPVETTLGPGEAGRVPIGIVHDVANRSPRNATSIHAYSPPLTSMGFYGAGGELLGSERVEHEAPIVQDPEVSRVLHPAGIAWRDVANDR